MSRIVFDRLVSPPAVGDRAVFQHYPTSGGYGGERNESEPWQMVGRDGSSPSCRTGQWFKTLPTDYPRERIVKGPTTLKHIYGTVAFDAKGKAHECRTGVKQNHDSYDYMYEWAPVNTSAYDASASLGPGCAPPPSGSGIVPRGRGGEASYRLGAYRNPRESFRTNSTLLWPANGRYVREPSLYTRYDWNTLAGGDLYTTVHPRPDPTVPPTSR